SILFLRIIRTNPRQQVRPYFVLSAAACPAKDEPFNATATLITACQVRTELLPCLIYRRNPSCALHHSKQFGYFNVIHSIEHLRGFFVPHERLYLALAICKRCLPAGVK